MLLENPRVAHLSLFVFFGGTGSGGRESTGGKVRLLMGGKGDEPLVRSHLDLFLTALGGDLYDDGEWRTEDDDEKDFLFFLLVEVDEEYED